MGTLFTPNIGVVSARVQLGEMPGVFEGLGMPLIFAGLAVLTWDQFRETEGGPERRAG